MSEPSVEFSYPAMIDTAESLGCYRWAEQLRENYLSESTRDQADDRDAAGAET